MFGLTRKIDQALEKYDAVLSHYSMVINTLSAEIQILRESLAHERLRNDELHELFYQYFGLKPKSDVAPATTAAMSNTSPLRRWRDQKSALERKFGQPAERPEELVEREKMWKEQADKAQGEVNQCQPSQDGSIG